MGRITTIHPLPLEVLSSFFPFLALNLSTHRKKHSKAINLVLAVKSHKRAESIIKNIYMYELTKEYRSFIQVQENKKSIGKQKKKKNEKQSFYNIIQVQNKMIIKKMTAIKIKKQKQIKKIKESLVNLLELTQFFILFTKSSTSTK